MQDNVIEDTNPWAGLTATEAQAIFDAAQLESEESGPTCGPELSMSFWTACANCSRPLFRFQVCGSDIGRGIRLMFS